MKSRVFWWVGVIGFVFVVGMSGLGWFRSAAVRAGDFLFVGSGSGGSSIVVVTIDESSLNRLGPWPWGRELQGELIESIWKADPLVVGYDVNVADPLLPEASEGQVFSEGDEAFEAVLEEYPETVVPWTTIGEAGTRAHVQVSVDSDGLIRRLPLTIEDSGKEWPAMSVELARQLGMDPSTLRPFDELGTKQTQGGTGSEPSGEGLALINYRREPGGYPRVSAAEVLEGKGWELLEGKVVMVGVSAEDLQDYKPTPISGELMVGVEIHAQALEMMLESAWLGEISVQSKVVGSVLFYTLMFGVVYRWRLVKGLVVGLLMGVGLVMGSSMVFELGVVVPVFYWALSGLLGFGLAGVVVNGVDLAARRYARRVLGRYVAEPVLREVMEDPSLLKLGGQRKLITVLFLDVRGFTSFSEQHEPEEVVGKLNELLSAVAGVIHGHGGTIDKFMGDAVMAFWGAPLPDELQASRAVAAALEIGRVVGEIGKFKVGVGINTGEAVVGNVGSRELYDYTAIGDTVNLGARLESATKEVGEPVLVSAGTAARLKVEKAKFKLKALEAIAVKGKRGKVKIWGVERG